VAVLANLWPRLYQFSLESNRIDPILTAQVEFLGVPLDRPFSHVAVGDVTGSFVLFPGLVLRDHRHLAVGDFIGSVRPAVVVSTGRVDPFTAVSDRALGQYPQWFSP
jgi:hypothetical protein